MSKGLDAVVLLLTLLPDVAVRANCETVQRRGAFLGPFGQGLRQEGQAGYQEQDALTPAGQGLRDLQAGKRLARTAGHDELAPVGNLQPGQRGIQGLPLMKPELFLDLQHRCCLGLVLGPLDLAVLQIVQVDLADGWLLVTQRLLGVGAPVVRRADNDPVSEWLLARGGEETVDVALLQPVVFGVQLALDRVDFTSSLGLGDQVDARVALVQPLLRRPFTIGPDLAVEVAVGRFVAQVAEHQLLEVRAFLALGLGGLAVVIK